MHNKSKKNLYVMFVSLFLLIATYMSFHYFDNIIKSKNIKTAVATEVLQDKNEVSGSNDTQIAEENKTEPPVTSPDPAKDQPAAAAAPAEKTVSKSTSTQTKPQKSAVSPKPASSSANSGSGISAEERNLFARLVTAEAAGESYAGKLAVATVIINRVNSGIFPNSITQVVMGKEGGYYQFTPVQDGRINNPPNAEAFRAVDQVQAGYRSFSPKVMWFLNPKMSTSGWIIKSKTYFNTIGNHDFYF